MRVPHKPLLLLWLFGQCAATGSSAASYQHAEEPVSQLINDFGPPVQPRRRSPAGRDAFVHLERDLWTCATPLARRSARTLPNAAPGYWTAEP